MFAAKTTWVLVLMALGPQAATSVALPGDYATKERCLAAVAEAKSQAGGVAIYGYCVPKE